MTTPIYTISYSIYLTNIAALGLYTTIFWWMNLRPVSGQLDAVTQSMQIVEKSMRFKNRTHLLLAVGFLSSIVAAFSVLNTYNAIAGLKLLFVSNWILVGLYAMITIIHQQVRENAIPEDGLTIRTDINP